MMNYRERIIEILIRQGAYVGEINEFNDEKFKEYFAEIDSLGLLNFIIELEEVFAIEMPEEYLDKENFVSIDMLCDAIKEISNSTVS